MKYLTILVLLISLNTYADKDREGDLQLPVTDMSQMNERQEEEMPPTIDEIKMEERPTPQAQTQQAPRKEPERSPNRKK